MNAVAYLYDAEGEDQEVAISDTLIKKLSGQQLLWIDIPVKDKKALQQVADVLKLHNDSVKMAIESPGRPRLLNYGHYFQFGVMSLNSRTRSKLETNPVEFICGDSFVVTVHDQEVSFLKDFREQDRGETKIGAMPASALLAAMLDWHLSGFFQALEHLEMLVDKIDDEILERRVDKEYLTRLVHIRKRLSQLRRILLPHREVFFGLTRPDFAILMDEGTSTHFQALNSRFDRVVDAHGNARELVLGSFNLFTSRTAESTNDFIKALTFTTFLLGLVGAVAGIFGMNFETSVFTSGSVGFWSVVFSLLAIVAAAITLAKHKEWI